MINKPLLGKHELLAVTRSISFLFTAMLPIIGHAGHAVVPLGFGAESNAMGGTDMAYSSSPSGINNNPAGISRSNKPQLEVTVENHVLPGIRHKDELGNDARTNHDRAYLFGGGWATPLSQNRDVTLGLGLFAQGGVGFDYEDLQTRYGNRDSISAIFGVFRVSPAIAYTVNDQLRLGGSVSVNYSEANQELFPATSSAQDMFFGTRITDVSGFSYSWRVGLQYDLSSTVTLGMAYGAQTELKLEDGSATVNLEALGLGRVRYNNASITGLSLPQEFGIGLSWQLTPQLNIGADVNWYEWSEALGSVRTHLSRPTGETPQENIRVRSRFYGQDNLSQSVATVYKINDHQTFYTGVSYTAPAIERKGISPVNNLLAKWHISGGFKHEFDSNWSILATYTFGLEETRTYINSDLPLGDKSEASFAFYSLLATARYTW